MIDRSATSLIAALTATAVLVAGSLVSTPVSAAPAAASILRTDFCLVATPFEANACRPVAVTLPHRFEVAAGGPSIGWYRVILPRPSPGRYALTLSRLSLDGTVRVDGRVILDTMTPRKITRQRYWPQRAVFDVDGSAPSPLVVDIAVRGLSQTKNGLGGLALTDAVVGEHAYRRSLMLDVMLVAALAAAALIAGIVGLAIRGDSGHSTRVLTATSWLAVIAALRCAHNLVTQPPTDMLTWHLIGVWLLALVALQSLQVVVAYLHPARSSTRGFLLAAIGTALLLYATADPRLHATVVDVLFTAMILVASGFFAALAQRVWHTRDTAGVVILLAFLTVIVTGLHDLSLHLGNASLSDRYLQTWSMPAVVILSIVALARNTAERRGLELALQEAKTRREELLRDLHDRVGSRLVALAFHAQQRTDDPSLLNEIKSLITEVRMIQNAVGAEATTLEALIADLRHHYSYIGGGRLPLRWDIFDLPESVPLSADQAIAMVRIVEESVANALQHAAPSVIGIRLSAASGESCALLEISDDGTGEFRPGATGGLHNIEVRARQAGFGLELLQRERSKAIRLLFPASSKPRSRLSERMRQWFS